MFGKRGTDDGNIVLVSNSVDAESSCNTLLDVAGRLFVDTMGSGGLILMGVDTLQQRLEVVGVIVMYLDGVIGSFLGYCQIQKRVCFV